MVALAVLIPLAAACYDLSVGAVANIAGVLSVVLLNDNGWGWAPRSRRDRRGLRHRLRQRVHRGQARRELVHRHAGHGLGHLGDAGHRLVERPAAAPDVDGLEQLHPDRRVRLPDRRPLPPHPGGDPVVADGAHAGRALPVRHRRQHRGRAPLGRPGRAVHGALAHRLGHHRRRRGRHVLVAQRPVAELRQHAAAACVRRGLPRLHAADPGAVQRLGDAAGDLRAGHGRARAPARIRRRLAERDVQRRGADHRRRAVHPAYPLALLAEAQGALGRGSANGSRPPGDAAPEEVSGGGRRCRARRPARRTDARRHHHSKPRRDAPH